MSNDPFGPASSGGNFSNKDHLGDLLLITPTEYVKEMQTTAGVTDAVRANIVVIDESDPENGSEEYDDALLFGRQLVGGLRPKIGKGIVLGRLGQGAKQPGKNAPWVLEEYGDEEAAKARAYLATKAPQL